MKQEKIEELASGLSQLVGDYSCKESCDLLVQKITCDHRTSQQTTMRNIVIPLIKTWAECANDGWYDARNRGTVELCKQLMPIIEDACLPFI